MAKVVLHALGSTDSALPYDEYFDMLKAQAIVIDSNHKETAAAIRKAQLADQKKTGNKGKTKQAANTKKKMVLIKVKPRVIHHLRKMDDG